MFFNPEDESYEEFCFVFLNSSWAWLKFAKHYIPNKTGVTAFGKLYKGRDLVLLYSPLFFQNLEQVPDVLQKLKYLLSKWVKTSLCGTDGFWKHKA